LAIESKALTWEIILKRDIPSPRKCVLHKNNEEIITHLLITYPYPREVWSEMDSLNGKKDN
jgi:hypothetical protein